MSRPTMDHVAERAGVSRALVSLVMRDSPKVSDARRTAVLEAAAELGYRPNVLARNLASRRTDTIGVVIDDLHNPFFAEIIDGIQAVATTAGYRVILVNGCRSESGEIAAIDTFLDYRVDAMVLLGPRLRGARVAAVTEAVPTVVIGRALRSHEVDTVNNNEAHGAQLAVKHLITLGHGNIAHIDGGTGAGAAPRRAGYERAMTAAGLSGRTRIVRGDFTERSGADAAAKLLESGRRPTAIFAANDQSAIGALDAAGSLGLSIPHDLSIIGYDNTAISATRHLSLTTIHQPRVEMGRVACRLALEGIELGSARGVHHIVTPSLVVRSTTSAPPANRS